jgi:hypothetical protein
MHPRGCHFDGERFGEWSPFSHETESHTCLHQSLRYVVGRPELLQVVSSPKLTILKAAMEAMRSRSIEKGKSSRRVRGVGHVRYSPKTSHFRDLVESRCYLYLQKLEDIALKARRDIINSKRKVECHTNLERGSRRRVPAPAHKRVDPLLVVNNESHRVTLDSSLLRDYKDRMLGHSIPH